jgi:hypothetical protein
LNFTDITKKIKYYYINNKINNNIWEGSEFEWIKKLSTCEKGNVGEKIINSYYILKQKDICKRSSVENDTVINNKKIEVKLSCLNGTGCFKWLQIRLDDDFDYLFLISVYPNEIKTYKFSKDYLLDLEKDNIIKNQHGGKRNKDFRIKYLSIHKDRLPYWFTTCEVVNMNNRLDIL